MSKHYIFGSLTGTHKKFVDKLVRDIKNRLIEVYGEILPKELENQLEYIVTETYKATRSQCVTVWNVEPINE